MLIKNMTSYKHTQIGYLMLVVMLAALSFFTWLQITARAEAPSVDSGANFAITSIMIAIVFIIASFTTLTVSIDEKHLKVKFGFGLFFKTFLLDQIASARQVKNHWYYGWGIKLWLWPYMVIYNISGLDAVEITTKKGRIYRIGTDEPQEFETAIKRAINIK